MKQAGGGLDETAKHQQVGARNDKEGSGRDDNPLHVIARSIATKQSRWGCRGHEIAAHRQIGAGNDKRSMVASLSLIAEAVSYQQSTLNPLVF